MHGLGSLVYSICFYRALQLIFQQAMHGLGSLVYSTYRFFTLDQNKLHPLFYPHRETCPPWLWLTCDWLVAQTPPAISASQRTLPTLTVADLWLASSPDSTSYTISASQWTLHTLTVTDLWLASSPDSTRYFSLTANPAHSPWEILSPSYKPENCKKNPDVSKLLA